MKTLTRCDLVPVCDEHIVPELRERAVKCGLTVMSVNDKQIDGEHFKLILFSGTRWSYIKYMVTSMVKDGVELSAIPDVFKLMFTS